MQRVIILASSVSGVSCYKVTGDPQSTLTIDSSDVWQQFAQSISDGLTYEGVLIELNSDFGVTDMVDGRFKGTLNGKGHQITFNYTQDTENDAALFKALDGATIKFLDVVGTINTSKKYAAAIAAHTYGTININSCISRVTINSTISGDGTHAGFVAVAEGGSTLNINNCLFAGTIKGADTYACAGFVGWVNNTLNVSNSLMAGDLSGLSTTNGATFSRRSNNNTKGNITNSYYTASYGTEQGTAVGEKTNEELAQDLGIMWTVSENDEVVPSFDVLHDLAYATVSGINTRYAYTGNVIAVNPVVTSVDGTVLTEGVDYTAALTKDGETVANVQDAGTYTYTFTPAANSSFTGTLTSAEFTVGLIDLSSATVTGINAEYIYSGSDISITPVITASDEKVLTNGTEYTTELKKDGTVVESVNGVGAYTYTFTGVEAQGYTGAKTAEFIVKLVKPTGIQHTAYGDTTATLSWDAQNNVTGYELQYSKDSSFPEGSGTVTVTENTAALTGLDTDSKYYARVRTLSGDYSSEWSDTAAFETTSKRWIGLSASQQMQVLPFDNYYKYNVTEQIYTVQEIGEAGLITSVDFMKVENNNCERNIDVYMVHTDKDYFSGSSDAVAVTEADKVFSGTVDFAYNEWTTISFDKSFNYNGTQNVVLVIDDNTGKRYSNTKFKAFSINNTEALFYQSDSNNYSPTDLSGFNFQNASSKNAVRFGIGNGHTVSIDQNIQNGTVSTTTTKEVAGKKVTFSVTPAEGYYCNGVSVNNGAVAVTKNADGTYSFTMPDGDAVISATFAQRFNVAVTWKNWDGTVLDTQQVGVEEVPSYSGATPTRPDDDYYSYTFKGWDKEVTAIAENKPVEFTAVYNRQPHYQIPFTVCDGTDINEFAPYYGFYNETAGNITQSVYPSSMLANMKGKDIYSLTYYMSAAGGKDIVVKGMKVYLLEVDNDAMTGITNVAENANAVKVFEGDYTLSTSGTMRIDFTTPYRYNGGNLLISIQNSTAGEWSSRFFYGTNTDNVSSYNHYNNYGTSIKFLPKCSFGIMDESKYSVTLPEGMEFCDGSSTPAVAGSTVQFKVKEGYTATNVQANGTAMTATDGIYSLMVTENVTVTADIMTEVIINSVDINGITTLTTVYKENYTSADYTVPASPYLDGYTFSGWKVNDVLYTTADDVQSAVETLVKAGTEVTVAVVYTKKEATHTVAFTADSVGCTIKDADGNVINAGASVNVSEQLYAIANMGSEEQVFSHWMIGDTIVGYETTYAFRMPDNDITLSAVYTTPDKVEAKVGTGYIESVKRTAENKLSFVSILCVPDNCQMLKAGVVVQSTDTLNGAELTTANAKLIKYSDTSAKHYSSFKYTWTMSTSNHDKKWTVRPYLEYTDKNGDTQVIYGDAVSYCVNDVSM